MGGVDGVIIQAVGGGDDAITQRGGDSVIIQRGGDGVIIQAVGGGDGVIIRVGVCRTCSWCWW